MITASFLRLMLIQGESSVEEQMSEAKLWLAKLLIVIQTTHSAYFPYLSFDFCNVLVESMH